LPLPLACG